MLARNAGKRGYLIKVPAFVIASLTGTSVKYTSLLKQMLHGLLTLYIPAGKVCSMLRISQMLNHSQVSLYLLYVGGAELPQSGAYM